MIVRQYWLIEYITVLTMERSNHVVSTLTKWQMSLLFLMLLTSCCTQSNYYVTPTPDTPCPGEPCHTLSQYVADQDFNNITVNTTMELLPGNHTLEQTISVRNLTQFIIHGDSSSLPEITSRIVCTWPAGFVFTGITELYISSLTFISCGHNDSAAVNIISVHQSIISNCSFLGNMNATGYDHNNSALYIHNSYVILARNMFQNNLRGAVWVRSSTLNIIRNTFQNNSVRNGGALFVQSSTLNLRRNTFQNNLANWGGVLKVESSTLNLTRNTFLNNLANWGGVLKVESSTLNLTRNTFLNNSANWGGVLNVESSTLNITRNTFLNNLANWEGGVLKVKSSTLNITRNTFQNNLAHWEGGALNVESSTLSITRNTFQNNSAHWEGGALTVKLSTLNITRNTFQNNSGNQEGGALTVKSSTLNITTNTFQNNSAQNGGALYVWSSTLYFRRNTFQHNSAFSGGAVSMDSSPLNLTRNTFQNNSATWGGALSVESSALNLTLNTFQNNSATWGGALSVESSALNLTLNTFQKNTADKSGGVLYVESGTLNLSRNIFQNNSAELDGGVLYINTSRSIMTENTFKYNSADRSGGALYVESSTLNLIRSVFQNNIADFCGGALYVLSNTSNQLQLTSNTFQNNSAGYGGELDIFSDQLHLCACINNLTDCTGTYGPEPVYPGGTLEVPVIAYGQWNGTTTAVLAVSNAPNGAITISNHENSRNIINYNSCSSLKYTIHSHAIGTTQDITLYIARSPCSHTRAKILTVTVGILSCPPGFQLSETQPNCICAERLQLFTNTCLIDYTTVLRAQDSEFWVGYDKKSQGLILHPHCPFDYCTSKETYLAVNDSDKQCNYNRSGLLCGRCSDNLSLALGSSRCLQCPNSHLSLLVVFVFAGVALVILLLVLRLTVAAGTINGLIFYANILAVNSATFFQPQTTNILTVFIAWLNLDLGIETCFYNGMDAYVKMWLQFAFPLYVWALVGMIIIGSHYSGRIAKIFGSNPVAVLATLFLISYAKLLRTVIATLSYTYLEYPNNSQIAVWLYDGNIRYLSGKHIPLFIAAMVCLIFLFFPYTMLLIFSQCLQAKSKLKIFSYINSRYVKPFLDAYHAPYSNKHRYWTGLMLLFRFVLFLIFAVNALGDPNTNLLAIASATTLIPPTIFGFRIYKTWSLGLLETSFIINLTILAVATLYFCPTGGNHNAATFTSVGIAFATFTGIVIYHSVQQIKGTRLCRRVRLKQDHPLTDVASGYEDLQDHVFVSRYVPTQTVVSIRYHELREPCMATD